MSLHALLEQTWPTAQRLAATILLLFGLVLLLCGTFLFYSITEGYVKMSDCDQHQFTCWCQILTPWFHWTHLCGEKHRHRLTSVEALLLPPLADQRWNKTVAPFPFCTDVVDTVTVHRFLPFHSQGTGFSTADWKPVGLRKPCWKHIKEKGKKLSSYCSLKNDKFTVMDREQWNGLFTKSERMHDCTLYRPNNCALKVLHFLCQWWKLNDHN